MTHIAGYYKIPLPYGVSADALYGGENNCYRYLLNWTWDGSKPWLLVIMMNPSTATEHNGDRTVAWVYRWARDRGYGRLTVCNSAAYRCTDQARLAEVADPVGPDNMRHILNAARVADRIIFGYGLPKIKEARAFGPAVARTLWAHGFETYAWALCIDGTPKHPLYLASNSVARPWVGPV